MKKIIFSTNIDEMWSIEDREIEFKEYQSIDGVEDLSFEEWSQRYFEDIQKVNISELVSIEECILVGQLGRWDGNYESHMFIRDVKDLTRAMSNFDYVCIYTEGGKTYFKGSGHDGSSLFELKKIRSKYDFYKIKDRKEGNCSTDWWDVYFGSINDKKLRRMLGWM